MKGKTEFGKRGKFLCKSAAREKGKRERSKLGLGIVCPPPRKKSPANAPHGERGELRKEGNFRASMTEKRSCIK